MQMMTTSLQPSLLFLNDWIDAIAILFSLVVLVLLGVSNLPVLQLLVTFLQLL